MLAAEAEPETDSRLGLPLLGRPHSAPEPERMRDSARPCWADLLPRRSRLRAEAGCSPVASFHIDIKTGGKGDAAEHGLYIGREGRFTEEKHGGVEARGVGNLPEWAHGIRRRFGKRRMSSSARTATRTGSTSSRCRGSSRRQSGSRWSSGCCPRARHGTAIPMGDPPLHRQRWEGAAARASDVLGPAAG